MEVFNPTPMDTKRYQQYKKHSNPIFWLNDNTMISNIYNTNQILFKSNDRKGKSKKDIQALVDKSVEKVKLKKTKKFKVKKIVNTKELSEKKREKARLQSLQRNPNLEIVDGKLVPKPIGNKIND